MSRTSLEKSANNLDVRLAWLEIDINRIMADDRVDRTDLHAALRGIAIARSAARKYMHPNDREVTE
jgi:hypothetical protein